MPAHEILVLIAYMQRPLFNTSADVSRETSGLNIGLSLHILCMRAVKALSSLHMCTAPEPSLFDNVISTKISRAGSNEMLKQYIKRVG